MCSVPNMYCYDALEGVIVAHQLRVMQIMGHMVGGGVEATIMNHYRHIDRSRVQFDFVIDADSTVVPKQEIEELGGRIFVVPPYRRLHEYCNACENIFSEQKPHIVHANLNTLSIFPLAAAKKAHVPVRIAHSHSTANPEESIKTFTKNVLRPFSQVKPTHLAACSTVAAQWLFGDAAVRKHKVFLMRNAIDIGTFTNNTGERDLLRSQWGVSEGQRVIGQVGRLTSQKNQLFTLKVFAALLEDDADAMLVIVGEGPQYKEILAMATELNIQSRILFLGVRHDMASVYQAFDVLIMPSLYEGLGMAAVEAQAAGIPVVVSTMVPAEADLLPQLITRCDLRAGVGVWAQAVLAASRNSVYECKEERSQKLASQGYEIRNSAIRLAKWYDEIA